jgi:16S rRNA (adenine1518-N6/adenine1519-N6)-dimethyltransferase
MIHHAKKSLGQNFLKSEAALQMMIKAGEVNDNDIVLEIGPGKGALTSKLLEKAKKVIAVEKDRDLIAVLEEKFKNEMKNKKLILLNEDILEFDSKIPKLPPYKVIANIPYNITGAIFKKFLSCDNQPERMVLLVQKEVAERIVAKENKESILSLSVKVYGTPKYVMKVSKRFFSPSPKVDSAIILIKDIGRENFKTKNEEEQFFKIIKTSFAHKRKVLRKNLEGIEIKEVRPASPSGRLPINAIDKMFEKLEINPKIRAEDVPFAEWLLINKYLSEN